MVEPTKESNYFGIPLRVVLNLPVFSKCCVLAGEAGLDRIVSGINLMDAPDIANWVTPGELMVTTCFAIKDNPEALNDLIPILSRSAMSGLCIKTKRYLDEMPTSMIETANALNFPLIELNPCVKFDTVINNVLELLLNHRTIFLQQLLDTNESLIKMIVAGVSLNKIAETMAALVDNSVLIVDSINHREAFSYVPGSQDKYGLDINHNCNEEPKSKAIAAHKVSYRDLYLRGLPHHAVPLTVGSVGYGQIYIWETNHPIQKTDISIINSLALSVTLEICKRSSQRDIENSHINDFLVHLLHDQIVDENLEIMRAQNFGIDLNKNHIVTHFRVISTSKEITAYNLLLLHGSVVKDIENYVKSHHLDCRMIIEGNLYTLIISEGGQKINVDKIQKILIDAFASVKNNYPNISLNGGIGRMYKGIHGIAKSFKEAMTSLKVYDSQPLKKPLLPFDELGLYRFIYSKSPETEVCDYIKETIGKLLEYEKSHNTDLLNTLEKYFEHNGNLKKMSTSMYTHYNTILYRMERIQEITELDLNNENNRLNLEIALKLYKINPGIDEEKLS